MLILHTQSTLLQDLLHYNKKNYLWIINIMSRSRIPSKIKRNTLIFWNVFIISDGLKINFTTIL